MLDDNIFYRHQLDIIAAFFTECVRNVDTNVWCINLATLREIEEFSYLMV